MSFDGDLIQLIQSTPILSEGDRTFLLSKAESFSPLEKLKIKQSLSNGQKPDILGQIAQIRNNFKQKEAPKQKDPITRVVQKIFPQKQRVLSPSILSEVNYLGSPIVKPHKSQGNPLESLLHFESLSQLDQLTPQHINFNLNENGEQIINQFLQALENKFGSIEQIQERREFFMKFVRSSMFSSYLNTGLTSLRHPELEPRDISLNLLYQIDTQKYLNKTQFKFAAQITHQLRESAII